MSGVKLSEKNSTENDKGSSDTDEKENSDTTIDMDMVEQKEKIKPLDLKIAESNILLVTDIENSIEPPADKNEEMRIDIGNLIDIKDLKIKVISQVASRRKFTLMALYQNMFGSGQQPHSYPRYPSPGQNQAQPQQSTWTQFGPSPGPAPAYGDNAGYGGYGYGDGGGPLVYDPRTRNSFVALVMGLVFIMLVATASFLAVVLSVPEVKHFFQVVGIILVIPAMIGILVVNCTMVCSVCGRHPPCNIILLFFATVFMSFLAAWITSHYRTEIILYAFVATGAVVFVCILLACSKFDFTSYLLYIIVIATAFSVIVMIILFTTFVMGTVMKPLILVMLIIGTLIQTVFLTMELQMILGGRTVELSEADYALAAFLVYTSILDIFLKMVQILGLTTD